MKKGMMIMGIMRGGRQVAAVLGFSLLLSGVTYALPSGSITVTNPGPLGSFSINTAAFDGTSGQIEKLTFDLSGTQCTGAGGSCSAGEPLVFGGLIGSSFIYDPESNGTSSVFGTIGTPIFGFNFTGFDPLNLFFFTWDPDVASNSGYGATVGELAGTVITASVRFSGGELVRYAGTMEVVGPDVAANLTPSVPEPMSLLLLGSGLAGLGLVRRKFGRA